MAKRSPREILTANLKRLGVGQTGAPNHIPQSFLVERGGPSQSTIARALHGETGATLETLEAIADYFKLEAWMLLVENLDLTRRPTLNMNSEKQTEFHRRVASLAKDYNIERRGR